MPDDNLDEQESAEAQIARDERLAAESETRKLRMQVKFREIADKLKHTRGLSLTIEDVWNVWDELSRASTNDWQ